MTKKGLLIDYMYCTGCHSCEVACQKEHDLGLEKWGIKLSEQKPFQIDEKKWEFKFVPIPTQLCDLCEDRVAKGKVPSCVLHCCAHCIECGDVSELAAKMADMSSKAVLFAL